MTLGLLLQDAQNVQVFEAALDRLRIAYGLFQYETKAVDHRPDEARRFKHVKERHQFAADELEQLGVVDLRVDELTVRDLLLFTLREAIIAAAQFNYVLWQLTRHLGGRSLLVLICSIQPKVHLLEHLMHAETVLKDKHLLQRGHGKRWNTLSTSWKGLRCAERA